MAKGTRFLMICLCIIIAYTDLFAQDLNSNDSLKRRIVDFSIYSGVSITNFIGETSEFIKLIKNSTGLNLDEKWRMVVPVGISTNFNITSWFSMKSGIVFAPKGIKYHDQVTIGYDDYGIDLLLKLQYLEIPTLIELSTGNKRKANLYINGGISPSFVINSKIVTVVWIIDSTPSSSDQDTNKEDWNDVNKFELDYIIGCGIKGKVTFVGFQYEKGFKTVSSSGWDFRNQALTFILGFYF